jgi:hypothetical protein
MKNSRLLFVKSLCIAALYFIAPMMSFGQAYVDGTVDNVVTPVKLLSFTANKSGADVEVNWSTANETNNNYFNIQRSNNGTDFSNIAKVQGGGTSVSNQTYAYTDVSVPNTNLYYRLQQVDNDGKTSFSSIVLIKATKNGSLELTVYPNPAVDHHVALTLNAPVGLYNISVTSMNGGRVYTGKLNNSGGQSSIQIQLPVSVPTGTYVIDATNSTGEIRLSKTMIVTQ